MRADDFQWLADKIEQHFPAELRERALQLIPESSDAEFISLCQSVEQNGFLHPIRVTDDMTLIDGRLRLQVGWTLSLDPAIQKFNPSDILRYVISENVLRQHLTSDQRALAGEKL